jgi:hypothetical protein
MKRIKDGSRLISQSYPDFTRMYLNLKEKITGDNALYKTYNYIYNRYCNVKDLNTLSPKEFYPLFALQSAPGGEKSFFFNKLVSLKHEDINLISNYLKERYPENHRMVEEVITLIRNSIGVCTTYNGFTFYDKDVKNSNI